MTRGVIFLFCLLFTLATFGQLSGTITLPDGSPATQASVFIEGSNKETKTDKAGAYHFENLKPGNYRIAAFLPDYQTAFRDIRLDGKSVVVDLKLEELTQELDEITVRDDRTTQSLNWLQSVSGTAIYEAKKSEIITLDQIIGNKAANVSRQVYARVPGLNIWENDGAGLQLGIGGRGLSPNRTSNFNTRQNGYDISADALGYPESYYTPPVQALERIEIIRGAAGLQYGTQFGGMLNFVFREGPKDEKIKVNLVQTGGSFGLFNSFNSVGGTVGKVSYYSFYQYKRSDGWRPNSGLEQQTAFGSIKYQIKPFLSVKIEHTHMTYLAQQAGGLTDFEFQQDARQSKRERNWFQVGWDLSAMEWDYRISRQVKLNNRTFHLSASRDAVGNLGRIDRPDDTSKNRNLLKDTYENYGNELRGIFHYTVFGQKSALVLGNRLYFGKTLRSQGEANSEFDASFQFLNPKEPEDSDFKFPSVNVAFFAENVLNIGEKWSVTPGIRYESIRTDASGYYFDRRTDLAGNLIFSEKIEEERSQSRDLLIGGIGVSYKTQQTEIYSNFSQNYRSINFNDIRVDNPSISVDENIHDERGFNFDLGARGVRKSGFKYDVSLFYLAYKDRIGNLTKTEPDPRFNNLVSRTFQYRTNIADAGIYGLEAYGEGSLLGLVCKKKDRFDVTGFVNLAIIKSEYLKNGVASITGNEVELVPRINVKTGTTLTWGNFGSTLLFTYLSSQYSDAGNTEKASSSAVDGKIPSYYVMDLSLSYKLKSWTFESGVNNLTNNFYYTRRASGYPGPGIIPSDGRSVYLTLGFQF